MAFAAALEKKERKPARKKGVRTKKTSHFSPKYVLGFNAVDYDGWWLLTFLANDKYFFDFDLFEREKT